MPASLANSATLTSREDALGQVALVQIAAGQPLISSCLSRAPSLPTGYTTVRLLLASAPESLTPGQSVQLIASVPCSSHQNTAAAEAQETPSSDHCLITSKALTMELPKRQERNASQSESIMGPEHSPTITFALPPEDAMKALRLPQEAAVIAVDSGK
ncbi:hypothetical protein KIMH_12960 [Bombiscardovia apis]|uniref:Uncharacterized protein n=1 Tax=Bombiscardovia apis TaxID=2932182 RepID=A0ABM8BE42_9BIFI|nr:hypothetical protein KIMH_12960 [Bombiscardovia apis]